MTDPGTRAEARGAARRPSLMAGAGHLAALWALAFAQPLFDLLGRNPDFFVARGDGGGDIVAFALLFALGPPAAMLAAEALVARFSQTLRWGLHLVLVALLAAALALQALKGLVESPASVPIALALALGALGTLAYARTRFTVSLLDVLIPAPLVVLAVFLMFSDVSKLVLPHAEARAADIRIPSRAPVVFVLLDELPTGSLMTPAGTIDRSRFPSFAELASESTWHRRATTVAAFTPRAVPAILTGRIPDDDALAISSEMPRSLFTLLGGSYRMKVMEDATQLCPEELCGGVGEESGLFSLFSDLRVVSEHLLLPSGISRHLPPVDATFGEFAERVNPATGAGRFDPTGNQDELAKALHVGTGVTDESDRFEEFISQIGPRPRTLHFLHVQTPHYPWNHLFDGVQYSDLQSEFRPFFNDAAEWVAPRAVTDIALQRHLLEVGFDDLALGRLIEHLRRQGIWERSLVVVTSDHGGAFLPGEARRAATKETLGEVAAVPLFVKAPGQSRGRVSDAHICTTDILPLIGRLLEIRYPWAREPCPDRRITVYNNPTGETSGSLELLERERDAFVDRIDSLFGVGAGWAPVLRFGPHPELIGRPVSAFRQAGSAEPSAEIAASSRYEDVDPDAPVVLASLVRGSLDGVAPGLPLAVAVNGRVAAVGRSFDQDGETRFSVIVPPRWFRPGANRVVIYEVLRGGRPASVRSLGPLPNN